MNKADHFSYQSTAYSKYRPTYPDALFDFLANTCNARNVAWDCGCGNGQASVGLAPYFSKVIASDMSQAQIERAQTASNIDYLVAKAEYSGFDNNCLDLILVAQALHWFDIDAFYSEARRVLKADGVLAIISYQLPRISADIDRLIDHFHSDIVGPYWPPQRQHVDNGYENIPFPLQEIQSPSFLIEHNWTLDQFLGYLHSWSATVYFEKEQKYKPTDIVKIQLSALWGNPEIQRKITWPLVLRLGRFD